MTPLTTEQRIAHRDAMNMLCEYVSASLPSIGWEITLSMRCGEATISLITPTGVEVDSIDFESDSSIVHGMCEQACEMESHLYHSAIDIPELNVPFLFWSCPECDQSRVSWSQVDGENVARCENCGRPNATSTTVNDSRG